MKKSFIIFIVLLGLIYTSCSKKREGIPKVLVFSKTSGWKHTSIPKGIVAIQKLGEENKFEVDTTSNSELFTEDILKKYSAVIFLNTTENVLDYRQEAAFERYIQAGGGYVGIHAATDTEYDWRWYGNLVGAYFNGHPKIQEATYKIDDNTFLATNFFTDSTWIHKDEMYNFKRINPAINVILSVDETTYKGGKNGDNHPMSWYHEYDGGRSFYTALGHTDECYSNTNFLQHLLGGIQYVIGENLVLDYKKAKTQIPPDADRLSKKTLSFGELFEPTEMTVLPNLDVLIAQRRGEIMLYKEDTKKISQIGVLDVYHETGIKGVNAEDGFLGLQKDPNYEENYWIYAFYSPKGDKWVNRLSRFQFKNDVFDIASEQIILDVESQRGICCHTGGSIAFGPDGLLFVSTGDNSTPFNDKEAKYVNNGFAPLNQVEGKHQYDARRSSGNTNDLRGKILRIRVKEDGSYEIPEGNLFPEGTANTRPEIYTMGHRNPYRIAIDAKRGYLYWGEVGPDAGKNQFKTRGPRGYDEVNQARKAGNFGWPLFVGDNYPYREYDYTTGESGDLFNKNNPKNTSINNTGLKDLPAAEPAFIWYPYAKSKDFPQLGEGGRNAMAGPTYYSDLYPEQTALPSYYDGKLIIYDWIRGWMKAVTLFPNGDYNKMEPFAPEVKINSLMDMEVAPNGRIYLLEYGSGWYSKNDNASLGFIDYNGGNRAPVVEKLNIDKTSGKLPLVINAKVKSLDKENDVMTYTWDLGNGETVVTDKPELQYTYKIPGQYKLSVDVSDAVNATTESKSVAIYAGNTKPKITIDILENKDFYALGESINYIVTAIDEDESELDTDNIYVSVDYLESYDQASKSVGHQEASASITGKVLTQIMDCRACHKENEKSVGPSYRDVSKKYKKDKKAQKYLKNKLKVGGSGVWGEVSMPAHPNVTEEELTQITSWILSLANNDIKKKSLPLEGVIIPEKGDNNNFIVITASYTDKGANGVKPLSTAHTVTLPLKK